MYTEKQGNVEVTRVSTSLNMVGCLRETPVMCPLTPADVLVFLFSICGPSDIHLRGCEVCDVMSFPEIKIQKTWGHKSCSLLLTLRPTCQGYKLPFFFFE